MAGLRALFATDHKAVARLHLWFGLLYLLMGGLMALNIRWQLAFPRRPTPILGAVLYARTHGVIGPHEYLSLFTLHGTVMIFFAVTPLVVGWLGNLLIPLLIGARGTAFPRVGLAGFACVAVGGGVLLAGLYAPLGGPAAGWTSYPTLATTLGSPGPGQTYFCVAVLLAAVGNVLTAVNYVATVVRLRAPGMSYFRLPLTVWGLWMTAILTVLFAPVLAAGTGLLLADRVLGTRFFIAGMAATEGPRGDPMLYQHLFWIFGHPEVYIVILPVWGVVSDVLSVFARKPAFGYRATALAFVSVAVLSGLVYGHHMFTTGLSPLLSQAFMTLTLVVSVPSGVFFLNWLGTLWRGAIRFEPPMLFALGVVFVFAVGGLTGLYLAAVSTDLYLHDSYFVVGHFHFVMAAAVLLGAFAAIHYWYPKVFGRMLNATLARVHFALTFVCMNVVFAGMLLLGWSGMMRRLYDPSAYPFLAHLAGANRALSYAAFVLGGAQLVFVGNFFWSMFRGAPAGPNPWNAATLEWSLPSPPPAHNFDVVPTVHHGPHEYARPGAAGRDWVAQHEAAE